MVLCYNSSRKQTQPATSYSVRGSPLSCRCGHERVIVCRSTWLWFRSRPGSRVQACQHRHSHSDNERACAEGCVGQCLRDRLILCGTLRVALFNLCSFLPHKGVISCSNIYLLLCRDADGRHDLGWFPHVCPSSLKSG